MRMRKESERELEAVREDLKEEDLKEEDLKEENLKEENLEEHLGELEEELRRELQEEQQGELDVGFSNGCKVLVSYKGNLGLKNKWGKKQQNKVYIVSPIGHYGKVMVFNYFNSGNVVARDESDLQVWRKYADPAPPVPTSPPPTAPAVPTSPPPTEPPVLTSTPGPTSAAKEGTHSRGPSPPAPAPPQPPEDVRGET